VSVATATTRGFQAPHGSSGGGYVKHGFAQTEANVLNLNVERLGFENIADEVAPAEPFRSAFLVPLGRPLNKALPASDPIR